jgi:hypothetical protein
MPKHSIESDSSTSSKRLKCGDSESSIQGLTTTRDSISRGKVQDCDSTTSLLHNKVPIPVLPSQTTNVITIPRNLNHEDYLNRLNYLFYNKKNLQKHLNLIDQIIRNDIKINN